jgi:hypothetical protein
LTTLHKAVFAVSFALALIWTLMLWDLMRRDRRRPHRHRWHVVHRYPSGHEKSRCACGAVRLRLPLRSLFKART